MKNEDKFGNTIYPSIFSKLLIIGDKLMARGFIESAQKPNLFYMPFDVEQVIDFKRPKFTAFADMRGTSMMKIWDDPCPMVYIKDEAEVPSWLYRKACCYIYRSLTVKNIPYRISNEVSMEGDSPDDNFPNGYCKLCGYELFTESIFCNKEYERYSCPYCGKKLTEAQLDDLVRDRLEFQNVEEEDKYHEDVKAHRELPRYYVKVKMDEWAKDFCDSEECQKRRKARAINQAVSCSICGIKLNVDYFDESYFIKLDHHLSYFPEQKMPVCASCHAKIHHSNDPDYEKYRPATKRPKGYKGDDG